MRPLQAELRIPAAADLSRTLTEARAIADGVGQTLGSTHLLLALFTVPNPAEVLLLEHLVNEDTILKHVEIEAEEPASAIRAILDSAEETALRCDARQTNTLHLLVALLKVREAVAFNLLEKALGPKTAPFRNQVMSFVHGVLPRRLLQPIQDARALDGKPIEATPAPASTPRAHEPATSSEAETRDVDAGSPLPPPLQAGPKRPTRHKPGDDWVVPKNTILDDTAAAISEVSVVEPPPAPKPEPQRRRAEPALPSQLTMPPTAFDLDGDRFPWLTALGRNLTSVAANGGLDPSIGRAGELEQLIDVLGKRRANNPCLVGEPGVGKTAIVEGLAVRLVRGDPDVAPLHGKVLVEIDMGRIVAGTSLRGSFSERMQGLKRDVQRAKGQVIVFIDEIHTLMGAGSTGEGPQDAANELKAALARGDFPCIGSTTHDEFKKHIEQDPALERRFVKIVVDEPDDAASIAIVRGAAPLYEKHHRVHASDDAICAAVQLSARFIHDKRLPAKALDLFDLALSRARRSSKSEITREDVARVCADVAKIPIDRVLLEDKKRFLDMEKFLGQRVVGHSQVIARVATTIRNHYAGFGDGRRPLGSFLFLGPSGVGKTELAKALADFLFGSEKALVRLDMSEYAEPHTVARLLGAPPGYVGHQEGGQLTEAVRARPHCIVLLDEIEKAHPDILPILLQVLDEGRLTDARGRTVTFRHAVVVLTSNLGAAAAQASAKRGIGFGAPSLIPGEDAFTPKQAEAVREAAKKNFAPELWGRIEDKLVFAPLGRPELMRIAQLMLDASAKALLTTRNIELKFDDGVLGWLVDQGNFDTATGARPMRQLVQRLVETPVSEAILRGEVHEGARIRLQIVDGKLSAKAARPTARRVS
jgi:ATP-dependent Clp protease ATP-binding subunit ClpC